MKVHNLNAAEELAAWSELLNRFKYEAAAVMDIQNRVADSTKRMWEESIELQKFALEMGYIGEEEYYSWLAQYRDDNFRKWSEQYNEATLELKKYQDSFYDDALNRLKEYETEFDTWYTHSVRMGELSVDEQIAAQERFANNYNAMVSQIVATTQLGSDQVSDLWNRAYEIRRGSEESIYSLVGDTKSGTYDKWKSDMEGWIKVHSTFDDWEKIGDSLVEVYSRAIIRQQEFYDSGIIGWQEYMDATLDYTLKRYRAASDVYDEMLLDKRQEISEMREMFSDEERALKESWTVSDRRSDMAEVNAQLAIYKNAATDKGRQRYEELLRQREELRREEQMYQLQLKNNAIIEDMEEDYSKIEESKKKVLSGLKSSAAEIEYSVDNVRELAEELGANYVDAASAALNKLDAIYDMLDRIRRASGSSGSTYNDSRNISISSGASENTVKAIINGTIVSGLGTVIY